MGNPSVLVAMKRRMNVANWRCSAYRYVLVISVALGAVFCFLPSGAYAGGVYFGLGVDVPLPGHVVAPPVEVYPPPVVVERRSPGRVVVEEELPPERVFIERAPAHRVVIEQPPPRVVVESVPPRVVYEGPVVVERRSRVTTYYRPAPQFREYREETEREYHGRRGSYRADDGEL